MGFTDRWIGPYGDLYIIGGLIFLFACWKYSTKEIEVINGVPSPNTRVKWLQDEKSFESGSYWTIIPEDVGDYNEVIYRLFGNFRPLYDEYIKFVKRIYAYNHIENVLPELGMREALGEEPTQQVTPNPTQELFLDDLIVIREGDIDQVLENTELLLSATNKDVKTEIKTVVKSMVEVLQRTDDPQEYHKIVQDIIDYLNKCTERTIVYMPEDEVHVLETFANVEVYWMRVEGIQKVMVCLSPHPNAKFIEGSANTKENFLSVFSPIEYSIQTTDSYNEEVHIHFCLLRPITIRDDIFLMEASAFMRFPAAIIYTWQDMVTYVKYFQTSRLNEARANFHSTLFKRFYKETSEGEMKNLADEMYARIHELKGELKQIKEMGIEFTPEIPRPEERQISRITRLRNWASDKLSKEEEGNKQ